MRNIPKNCALIAVSEDGFRVAKRLILHGFSACLYASENLNDNNDILHNVNWFGNGVCELTKKIFRQYDGLVYVMPLGIVVRAIAPYIKSKFTDPAVVSVDIGGRWVIAALSGHEGGANKLADQVSRILHSEPVVTTSTDASKRLIAGIGCGKGVTAQEIETAVYGALTAAGHSPDELRLIATVDIKEHEKGLVEFCELHNLPLRIISRDEIRESKIKCKESEFVMKTLGIGAVAEPCALLAGSKTELILEKQARNRVTVALAIEHFEW